MPTPPVSAERAALPLILLPGLGATGDVFAPQVAAFPGAVVPAWPRPGRGEDLAAYARRLATAVDPGRPCVVVGQSFGGFLATEVCRHLDARACVLISSVLRPEDLPRRARWGAAIGRYVPTPLIWVGQRLALLVAPLVWCVVGPERWTVFTQTWRADAWQFAWSVRAIASWRASPAPLPCPVVRIHGARDPLLPARCAPGAHVIPGGGHVITLFHGDEVNAALRDVLRDAEGRDTRS